MRLGSLGKQPLNDVFILHESELRGPFQGANAVQQFQDACGIEIDTEHQQIPIVFTHDDLVAPNILLSAGPSPSVVGIIDWAQSGWYPAYWEYCKARRVNLNPKLLSFETQEEWRMKYLPTILEPVEDEKHYHAFVYFSLTRAV